MSNEVKEFRSKSDIKRAAKEAGMAIVDLERLQACAEVGKIIDESGLVYLGLSMYASNKSAIEAAIPKFIAAIDSCSESDFEVLNALGQTLAKLVSVNNETATSIVKSLHNANPNRKQANRGLPPGQLVSHSK